MAAYAALVSLINIMEQIRNHPRLSTFVETKQIDSVGENVDILLTFIENHTSHGGSIEEAEVLEREITAAAQAAEDIFESHVVALLESGVDETTPTFEKDLHKVKQEMDFIKEKVMKVEEEGGFRHKRYKCLKPAASARTQTTAKASMVGFDGYSSQLMDRLTGLQSDRQVIPVVGMGGIGKTTLARNVYESSIILHYFHVRAWVTISQEYTVREVLLETLSCLEGSINEMDQRSEDQLGEQLYKILSGRRYIAVLDDMWMIEAWDRVKFFFPENHNGSRVVVTIREQEVADEFGSMPLFLNLLDESNSWDLFCDKAFEKGSCPSNLEEVGRSIVKQCKGLPLSIVVMGGLLGRSSMMQEYWENVEGDVNLILDDHCLNILSLSYNYLPAHLKPCFLYFGIFPEDHRIYVSKLIKLWAAEGFLKPHKHQTMEKVAAGYVKDLVGRNLILVHSFGLNKKHKVVYIHDLVRDLCLKMCEKEKFLCVVKEGMLETPQGVERERRVVIHESITEEANSPRAFTLRSTQFKRSIIYRSFIPSSFKARLLRVLCKAHGDSLESAFQDVNLRHLDYHKNSWIAFNLPSSISLFWSLQTLIISGRVSEVVAPCEIWEMPQLRHLKLYWCVSLPDPPPSGERDVVVLENLQTLKNVKNFKCSEEVCKRMPSIVKLGVTFHEDLGDAEEVSSYSLHNVGKLNKLESLKYFFHGNPSRDGLVQNLKFPSSLKKLTLKGCNLCWEDLTMMGSLPHLEALRLEGSVFGPEWNPNEGEFTSLRFLGVSYCADLMFWNAERCHFPVLEELVLEGLWKLEEIPLDLGEISTLRDIYVDECSVSAAVSAVKILEEQEGYGNEDLRVRAKLVEEKRQEFAENLEEEGLKTENYMLIE